jgi:hypothetical protein
LPLDLLAILTLLIGLPHDDAALGAHEVVRTDLDTADLAEAPSFIETGTGPGVMEQCRQIIQKLMPLMAETATKDILDGILKVQKQQKQQMKLAGLLQGGGGIRGCEIGRLARPSRSPPAWWVRR